MCQIFSVQTCLIGLICSLCSVALDQAVEGGHVLGRPGAPALPRRKYGLHEAALLKAGVYILAVFFHRNRVDKIIVAFHPKKK